MRVSTARGRVEVVHTATSTLLAALCALALAGCASTEPAAQDPGSTATVGPSSVPPPSPESPSGTQASDIPPEAMLPATAWDGVGPDGEREESPGVIAWHVPEACDAGSPARAAMRTVTHGSGEIESSVGVHQVAVLADADAAVAEADRLTAALTACTQYVSDDSTTYVVEPLDVGAQGVGLATDYYGASATGALDDAMGTYLAVTRRGNAVTLVGLDGGEGRVGTARETVTTGAQAAWELLCSYDSAGC